MKPRYSLRNLVFASSLLTISYAQAQSTWVPTAGGTFDWPTAANWSTNPTVPNGIGASANLSIDITGTQTIRLNSAITLGSLTFGDSSGTSVQNITPNGGSLIFDNGGAGATLTHSASTNGDQISAGITLNDDLAIVNNGTNPDRGSAINLSGKVTGSGGITINAGGTGGVYLSNTTNDYAGGLTLNAASAKVVTGGNGNAFGSGPLTINGGTIDTSFPSAATQNLTTSNANFWNGNWTLSTATWTNNGSVKLGANSTVTVSGTLVLNQVVDDGASTFNLGFSGGTTVLANANTYNGTTTLSGGTLRLTNTNAIANSSAFNVSGTSTLQLRSDSAATFKTPDLNLTTTANTITHTINVDQATVAGSNNQLALAGAVNRRASVNNTNTLAITGANGYSLSIPSMNLTGGNSLTLAPNSANVSIGAITATTGLTSFSAANNITLTLGGSLATGTNTISSITETSGAAQQLSIKKDTAATWNILGSVDTRQGNTHTVTNGTLNLGGTFTLGISGSGTSERVFTISGGTLGYNNAGAVATIGTPTATNNGAWLVFANGALDNTSGAAIQSSTTNPNIRLNQNLTFTGSNSLNLGTGLVNFGNATAGGTRTITVTANTLTLGGVIANGYNATPTAALTKAGAGTLTLTGANTFSGQLTVSAGTLVVNTNTNISAAGPLGQSALAVILGSTGGNTGTLRYTGGSITSSKPFSMATGGTGAFDVSNGAAIMTLSAATAGGGALSKVGAGTLALSSTPGHTGGTTVNGGTLALTGAINMPGTGALTVNGGGTFSLAEATPIARITTANGGLTIGNGSNFNFDWVNAAADSLTTSAVVTPTAGAVVGIGINASTPSGGPLTLITGAAGSALNNASYYLANNSNYTASLTSTATTVDINSYASVTALNSMYWTGNKLAGAATAGVDNALALSNGTASNWSSSPLTYTGTGLTPGSSANLFFSNVQADKTQQTAVLGADMFVNSITFDDSTAVTLSGNNKIDLASSATTTGSVDQTTGVGTAGSAITVTDNAANPTISANVALGNGQRWTVATGKTLTVSGSISRANTLTIAGGGTVVLSGTNYNSAALTVLTGSTLQIDVGGTLGNGTNAVTLGSGSGNTRGNLTLNTSATSGALTVESQANTVSSFNQLSIASGQSLTATSLSAGYFTAGADRTTWLKTSGNGNLILSGVLSMNTAGDASDMANALVDLSGLASFRSGTGTGTMAVGAGLNGKGTLTLANTSNVINVATISVGDSGSGNYNLAGTSTINLGAGTNVLQANSILLGAGKGAGILQFAGANGSVTITGAGGIGSATILMNDHSAGTNTGGTGSLLLEGHTATVSAGAVTIAQKSGTALGGSVPGLVTFDTGTFSASSVVMANNTGATGASGSITGTLRLGGAAANAAGTGVFNVSGNILLARTTAVGATNSSNGTLTINGGTVNMNTAALATNGIFDTSTVGTSTTTINLQGGTLNLNGGLLGSAITTGTRLITNLNFKSGTLQNVLQINDGAGLIKSTDGTGGGGTLILSGTNSFTGGVTINAGTVVLGSAGALLTTAGSENAVTFGSSTTGTLVLAGRSTVVSNLTGSAVGPVVTNANGTAVANATLTVGNSLNLGGTYAGVLQNGTGGGTLALTKAGTNTLTLSGVNTYGGNTNITGGTLALSGSGSIANSPTIIVGASTTLDVSTVTGGYILGATQTLTGTGTVVGAATINGIHAPGNSPGIQTFTDGLTYGSTATLNAEFVGNTLGLFGTDFDGVNVTGGTLTIDSLATLALFTSGVDYADMLWDSARDFTVIDFSGGGTSTGSFVLNTANAGSFASEGSWSLANTSNDIVLSWTPIPEPNVAALIGAFGGILLLRRRR